MTQKDTNRRFKFDEPEYVYGNGERCWDCGIEFRFIIPPKIFYHGWHPGYANTPNAYTMCVDCYRKWSKIYPQDDYREFNPNPGRKRWPGSG